MKDFLKDDTIQKLDNLKTNLSKKFGREIIFRAWSFDRQKMLEDIQDGYDFGYFVPFSYFLDNTDCVVMQYTGVNDDNNIKIFEFDIVKAKSKFLKDEIELFVKVVFRCGVFGFDFAGEFQPLCYDYYDLIVVGNEYETKNLINLI